MLNIEFIKQFTAFGSLLAGFTLSIAFGLIVETKDLISKKPRLLTIITATLLASSVFLILAAFMSALIISAHGLLPENSSASTEFIIGTNLFYGLVMLGALCMFTAIALSGFVKSNWFGVFTSILSVFFLISALFLYNYLL